MPPCRWWQVRSAGGASVQTQYAATARSSVASSPFGHPPGRVLGGEVERARGDVDVRDLHRDGLELRQAAAELGAALDVVRGEVAGADDDAGRGEAEPHDVPLGQRACAAPSLEQLGGGAVEDDGVGREARRGPRLEQGDAGVADVDECDDLLVALRGGHEQAGRVRGVRDADLAAGDHAVGVRRLRRRVERSADLADRRREDHVAASRRRAAGLPAARPSRARRG